MLNQDTVRTTASRLALAGVLLCAAASLAAEGEQARARAPVPGLEASSMAAFYTGDGQLGVFRGRLVCLRCDLSHAPGAPAQCRKDGHRHVLSMDDGSMMHPLFAGSQEIQAQINSRDLHGKHVRVSGKYYPATGAILVGSITADPEP